MIIITGSSRVAEALSTALGGRVKLEDAGFDWKILGPDVGNVSNEMHPKCKPWLISTRSLPPNLLMSQCLLTEFTP